MSAREIAAWVAKAITAGTTAAVGALATASVQDGVSGGEVAIVVLAGLGAAAAVFAVPDTATKTGRRRRTATEGPPA